MIYELTHSTEYEYLSSASQCHNLLHLKPRTISGRQTVLKHQFDVDPVPTKLETFDDYFGNHVHSFSIDHRHSRLAVISHATVEVVDRSVTFEKDRTSWESIADSVRSDISTDGLSRRQFCFASPMIAPVAAAREFGQDIFLSNRPIIETIRDLNRAVHERFTYDSHATTIDTPLTTVFEKRRGVCQDLSHAMLAVARSYGLAARYVSGYLRTFRGDEGEAFIGADQSHAWVSIFAGPYGWIDMDPTNKIEVLQNHVTIGWGRDFSDVTPVKGLFTGAKHGSMRVGVTLRPID